MGGFQHAVIEYARNVLGMQDADHAETNPNGMSLVIAPLSCSLVEKSEELTVEPDSIVSHAYGTTQIIESYRCSYGVNPAYADKLFREDELRATVHDATGQVRAIELSGHPFFVGTLFQPERRALRGEVPPLVGAFVHAITTKCAVTSRIASRTSL
jgi:CTP synthase (UTP-ammonia lyase)